MAKGQTKKDLMDRCTRARADIAALVDWFECELERDEQDETTWATLGSLAHVRDGLKDLLAFFSGIPASEIQRSLEELHA